jgi:hypothetical protein
MKHKNRRENERNKGHDKIIQYFPQSGQMWPFVLRQESSTKFFGKTFSQNVRESKCLFQTSDDEEVHSCVEVTLPVKRQPGIAGQLLCKYLQK